ncbi:amidase [Microbacterium sp. NPDC089698]|uniref:amidase n=1 Tax=Microbacterium sp. NPDC089698 TaxID=3364200 RepID=UPI0038076173
MTIEPTWMTAYDLAVLFRQGRLSPVDAVDAALDQLERANPAINAFVTVTAHRARSQAIDAAKRLRAGEDLPPLFGIPITVKDLIDTDNVRTTYGSLAYTDNVPTSNHLSWDRLERAGAIMVGKTTTPEFGLLGTTESHLTGITNNPWDIRRTSGGSSGGAAAATAAGIAPLALGSDGGGSIRVPAALCGVVGFKPSVGRIPHADNADASTTDGPITRRVIDTALMLNATIGYDRRDRFSLPDTGEDYVTAAMSPTPLKGLRIAASPDLGIDGLDSGVATQYYATLDRLRRAGAVVSEVGIALPDPSEYFVSYWGPEYELLASAMTSEGQQLWPFIEDLASRARGLSALDVSMAMRQVRTQLYNSYMRVLADHEFLVTPTTPTLAPTHEKVASSTGADGAAAQLHRLTESPSHAGLPALTVPVGVSEGLPTGIQIIGQPHADARVISFGAAVEQLIGHEFARPPLQ